MKIVVGMSGGVDSAVSAMLLKQAGHSVSGLFMKNWDEDDGTEYCTAATDLIDAEGICHRLGIELHTANFAREYWDNVFAHFLSEYRAGRTPNPDVLCNREIKFAVFAEHAVRLGADAIATGHYARLDHSQGQPVLVKGVDPGKDQSYFLHAVSPAQMANVQFPLGDLHKSAVRDIAQEHSLHVHDRKDSTGICFIGERRFSDFLARYLPAQPGLIEDEDGRVIGEHSGLMYYTIGQRQGLRIGGLAQRAELPWYAAAKDLGRNVLTVVQGNDHPLLFIDTLTVGQTSWWGAPPNRAVTATAKVRYRQADQTCDITPMPPEPTSAADDQTRNAPTSPGEPQWQVRFAQPQRAVTPGQYAVFYDGDHCLGGGVIQ